MTRSIAMLVLTMVCAGAAWAQNFPSKPLHIFTTGAGAGNDTQARIIGQVMGPSLGQPVIVENRAGGNALAEAVARPIHGHDSGGNSQVGQDIEGCRNQAGVVVIDVPIDPKEEVS